jgi:hypothetical protein
MKCKHHCLKKNINQCLENINVNCPLYMMHTVCFLLLYSLKVVLCDCEIFSISIPNCPSPIVLLYISVGHFVWKQCWILVYMSSPLFSASNMLALVSVLYKLDFFMFYYIKKSCKKACTAAIDIIVQFHLFPHCFWGGRTQNDRLYWKFGCTGITNWRHWRMFVHYRNGDNWISSIYFHARHLKLVAWSERYGMLMLKR